MRKKCIVYIIEKSSFNYSGINLADFRNFTIFSFLSATIKPRGVRRGGGGGGGGAKGAVAPPF